MKVISRHVQTRLDEPSDAELRALLQAQRAAGDAWHETEDAIKDLYRSLTDHPAYGRVLDRMRELRIQITEEERHMTDPTAPEVSE